MLIQERPSRSSLVWRPARLITRVWSPLRAGKWPIEVSGRTGDLRHPAVPDDRVRPARLKSEHSG
jgi:hypothetical protein